MKPAPRPRLHSSVALLAFAAIAGTVGCLKEETIVTLPHDCTCAGSHCMGSVVGLVTPSSDEEAGDCAGCHFQEIGRCVDGCASTAVIMDVPGCAVAFACKSWDRVEPGASCATRFDCEPGSVNGEPVNTLDCVDGRCVDLGAAKWQEVSLEPRACEGLPHFGPHPQCAGAECLSPEQYGRNRFCSAARCLGDADCPTGWFCRCHEETTWDNFLYGWRWCVPAQLPDGGVPDAGKADAGEADAGGPLAGEDAGQPDETPDGGQ